MQQAGKIQIRRKNESARTRLESADARLNSPPPKSAHQLLYVLITTKGMARTGDADSTKMVGPAGVEPATLGLEIRCSIRLSYGPSFKIN
jgi:hypothetical protein